MRVFIAALEHETNSFSPIATDLESFRAGLLYRPNEESPAGCSADSVWMGYSDFIKIARSRGHDVVISLAATAQPSAPMAKQDYETLRDEILNDLRAAGDVDMVLMFMHGAQMAVGYDDCEGDMLTRIRSIAGPGTAIGCELDLHCNISPAMLSAANILMACKEYPHTDFSDRALDLYNLIQATAEGVIKPVTTFCSIPMLSKFFTTREPFKSFLHKTTKLEGQNGILSITLAHSFPWSDTQHSAAGVLIVSDAVQTRSIKATQDLAQQLAQEFFSFRKETHDKALGIEAALDRAEAATTGPIIIADSADNAGGGAPGDSTFILQAMLRRDVKNAALAMICDPETVQSAIVAGVGSKLALQLGGKHGETSGPSLELEAEVTAIAETATQRGLDQGRAEQLGACATLRIKGVDIVLNSIRQQVFSPDVFTQLGIDPTSKSILVVKSSQHFFELFAPLVMSLEKDIIYCDAPGALNSQLKNMPYKKLTRPIWPLDEIQWEATSLPQSAHQNQSGV